jgi:hypothetical protein
MPQTLLVLPSTFADRIPGMLVNAGLCFVRDRERSGARTITCERERGRVTVVYMRAPEWARRLDETLAEDTVLLAVQRSSWRLFRRAADHELLEFVVRLFESHALMRPSRLGRP